ncbi:MAG: urease accessory protein UreE [Rhodospirillales bacterium]|nr:urease accessory protein UreE [Rhodospirillales bacterium]MDE2319857.1 urease accessory protein UreE [Rhodospirillales bacterium]
MSELLLDQILGNRNDPDLAKKLHDLGHHGGHVETLVVSAEDLPRRRFHAQTDHGTPCFIALPRDVSLVDGAVLYLTHHHAIVLKVGAQDWLKLQPLNNGALELGHLAGNLHWRVRFEEDCLLVAVDHPRETYLARLHELEHAGKVKVVA